MGGRFRLSVSPSGAREHLVNQITPDWRLVMVSGDDAEFSVDNGHAASCDK
jgi:hypothetical protein